MDIQIKLYLQKSTGEHTNIISTVYLQATCLLHVSQIYEVMTVHWHTIAMHSKVYNAT